MPDRVDRLIGTGYLQFVPEPMRAEIRMQLICSVTIRYLDSEWNDGCVAGDLRS